MALPCIFSAFSAAGATPTGEITSPHLPSSEQSQHTMDRFHNFCQLFADFPSLQSDLSLLDRQSTNGMWCWSRANAARAELTNLSEAVPRAFNGAQVRSGMPPPPRRPQEPLDDRRERQIRGPPNSSVNPVHRQNKPRRASESSIMEKERRPRIDREELRERTESSERRRRERRAEREERHRREKEKVRNGETSSSSRSKKPRGLDIIDKLDVTGIYGQGRKCR